MDNYRIGPLSYDHYLNSAEVSELRRDLASIKGFVACKNSNRGGYYPNNGRVVVRSYRMDVASFDPETGELAKLWDGWSRTTSKHIDSALESFGFRGLSKAEWRNLSLHNLTCEVYELARI